MWESLKVKYPVFKGILGEVTRITAKLVVEEKAITKFFNPRPVPYVLKQKISEELEQLESEGVIEKIFCLGCTNSTYIETKWEGSHLWRF